MIDYNIISKSIDFYAERGFVRVETPWTVTEPVSSITKPKGAKEFKLVHENGKVLVASGEQSFLYQYLKGFLPLGTYQTVTPCWRFETFDTLHTKYFIKNELIDTKNVSTARLDEIVNIALAFFSTIFPKEELRISGDGITGLAYDINLAIPKGPIIRDKQGDVELIELGSYGIRSCDYLEWIYATGVAEPRTSSLLKRLELKKAEDKRIADC